jgi:pilus assembly protein CpaB
LESALVGSTRIIILAVAAFAAIGLALVVRNMAAGNRHLPAIQIAAPAPQIQTVKVLVAKRDLPVGSKIAPADVSWQTFPASGVNPIWIVDRGPAAAGPMIPHIGPREAHAEVTPTQSMTDVTGAVVRIPLLAGEPIVPAKIVKGGAGGYLSVSLEPGMRAIAIAVNPQTGVGGFILPGDRVDILLTRKDTAGGPNAGQPTVEPVLRNIQVLAVDQQVAPPKDAKSMVGGSITLEVPAEDVEVLLGAEGHGDLALALRSYADLAGAPERGRRAGKGDVVTFIRAGQVSEVASR